MTTRVLAALLSLAVAVSTHAQLKPDRLYYGINRPVPMQVSLPPAPEGKAWGDLHIDLYTPGNPEPIAVAPVEQGKIDLGALFPIMWGTTTPKVQYAQLVAGTEKVGPPVVLQPMVNPAAAMVYSESAKGPWFIDPKTLTPSFKPRDGQIAW